MDDVIGIGASYDYPEILYIIYVIIHVYFIVFFYFACIHLIVYDIQKEREP